MRRSGLYWAVCFFIAILAAGAAFAVSYRSQELRAIPVQTSPPVVTVPSDLPTSTVVSASPTPTEAGSKTVPPKPSSQPIAIKGSEPVELYFPSLKKAVSMDNKSCPQDPDGLFDPDRNKMMSACYVDNDNYVYVLPGTKTADVSVIYGHTWRQGQASFNILYDWQRQRFTINKGDEVWVRTRASGKRWLVYKASEFFKPAKYGDRSLRTDTKIWGKAPMPDTLITAGCLQPQDLDVHSTRNIVIKWTFAGVKG